MIEIHHSRCRYFWTQTTATDMSLSVESGNIKESLPEALWEPGNYYSATIFR